MNLLIRAVMNALEEVGRAKELPKFRVGHKVNARGENVVAPMWPESTIDLPRTREERAERNRR